MSPTSTPIKKSSPTVSAGNAESDSCFVELRKLGQRARNRRRLFRECIKLIAAHYDAPYASITADLTSGTLQQVVDHGPKSRSQWHEACDMASIDAHYRNQATAKIFESSTLDSKFAVLSAPLHNAESEHHLENVEDKNSSIAIGSITVVASSQGKRQTEQQLTELVYLIEVIETLAMLVTERQSAAKRTAAPEITSEATLRATDFSDAQELAFSLANGVKSRLQIDHVAIGTVSKDHVNLLSMSGFDELQPRNPGVRLVQQAMEECMDARSVVFFQKSKMLEGSGANLLHKVWHRETGNSSVASIPLFKGDRCVAIVSLRNRASRPIDKEDLRKVEHAVEPFLPGLRLLEKANRGIVRTIADRFGDIGASTFAKDRPTRALVAAVVVGLMSWLLVATAPFRFTVPCEVVPQQVLHFSSPMSGSILSSNVKQGDSVEKGQILVEFDTRELLAEQKKLTAELAIANTKLNSALAADDDAAAIQADSEIKIANAKLSLVDSNIEKAVIRAPFNAVVLSGDTRSRVGQVVPVGDPLIALGRPDPLRVRLRLPEHCVQYADTGQVGFFVTNARANAKHPFEIENIPLSSTVEDGKTIYVAEATIEDQPTWLRVGMTGYAKVTGRRERLWWIATRKVVDAIRLRVWRL